MYLSLPQADGAVDAVLTQGIPLALGEGAAHVQTLRHQPSFVHETLAGQNLKLEKES